MGFNDILKSLFGNKADRDMKELRPIVAEVNAEWEKMKGLSNDELRAVSADLKKQVRDYFRAEEEEIEALKRKVEEERPPIEERERIYDRVDKLEEQRQYMEMIHHAFDPMEIRYCETMRTELRGLEKLKLMGDMIYGDEDPAKVYAAESPMRFVTVDGVDRLEMRMPFVDSSNVELFRIDQNTLMVHVGSQKRNILLPDALVHAQVIGADFKDEKLVIRFKRD